MSKINTESFIEKAKVKHKNLYSYLKTNYINYKTNVIITCMKHGDFEQRPDTHLRGSGCNKCNLNKRVLNINDFIKRANKVHNNKYNYSKVILKNTKEKVCILCNSHGEFLQTPHNHIICKNGCPKCRYKNNTYSLCEFIKDSKTIHNNYYSYDLYCYYNNSTKSIITCPIHGNFNQSPKNHLIGQGCPKCKGAKIRKSKQMGFNMFKKQAMKIHNNMYLYKEFEYVNNLSKAIIICKKHGEFQQRVTDHLNSKGCSKCFRDKLTKTLDKFIDQANKIHDNYYNYDKFIYTNNATKSIIICPSHGDFKQSPSSHLSNHGCKKCTNRVSKNEMNWLSKIEETSNIKLLTQYKVPGTKFIVDGFCKATNTIYEFNGDYWHGNPKKYHPNDINSNNKKTFRELYNSTIKKENILKRLGYNIVSIWESDFILQLQSG